MTRYDISGLWTGSIGVLKSNSHSFNYPNRKNLSVTGWIPSLSSWFRGYCLTLTGCRPSLSLTSTGGAFFALPGTSVAHTPEFLLWEDWLEIDSVPGYIVDPLAPE